MKRIALFGIVLSTLVAGGCASVEIRKEQASRVSGLQLRQALDLFRMDNGRYPDEEEGLAVLVNPGKGKAPYLSGLANDPWGRPYRYRLVDGRPVIDSAGPDRRYDTTDDLPLGRD